MGVLSIFVYLGVAALVVFFSIKLSDYVDLLDKKTNLSGALVGGILLAAVTSLPELFTSITSTIFLGNNSYVMGNILGSDIFNVTLFAVVYLVFFIPALLVLIRDNKNLRLTPFNCFVGATTYIFYFSLFVGAFFDGLFHPQKRTTWSKIEHKGEITHEDAKKVI